MTSLAESPQVIEFVLQLEQGGALTPISLDLTDPNIEYDRWESLGRFLGAIDRASRWWVGDWLNFGEAVFGETAAQGIEATTSERYSEAERVTGLDHGTLMNIRSVCGKIAKSRRRHELGFWIHAEVAALDPEEQTEWLGRAIEEGWNKSQLRQAIRDAKSPPDDRDDDDDGGGEPGPSVAERVEQAARLVWNQAQSTSDGGYLVPASAMSQLAAALGESD